MQLSIYSPPSACIAAFASALSSALLAFTLPVAVADVFVVARALVFSGYVLVRGLVRGAGQSSWLPAVDVRQRRRANERATLPISCTLAVYGDVGVLQVARRRRNGLYVSTRTLGAGSPRSRTWMVSSDVVQPRKANETGVLSVRHRLCLPAQVEGSISGRPREEEEKTASGEREGGLNDVPHG